MALPSPDQQLISSFAQGWVRIEQRLDTSLSNIKGITFSEYRMLRYLGDSPTQAASRSELATALARTPSGVTRALKPLEKRGMVTSQKSEHDARRTLAHLTAQGKTLVDDASGVVNDVASDILDSISREQRKMIQQSLAALGGR